MNVIVDPLFALSLAITLALLGVLLAALALLMILTSPHRLRGECGTPGEPGPRGFPGPQGMNGPVPDEAQIARAFNAHPDIVARAVGGIYGPIHLAAVRSMLEAEYGLSPIHPRDPNGYLRQDNMAIDPGFPRGEKS